MKQNWHGLMKIESIQHLSKDGEILWEDQNIYNTLHTDGEEFLLKTLFTGTGVPSLYYFGLDNRASIAISDTMTTIDADGTEPGNNGYARQSVSSVGQFTVAQSLGINKASSPILSFTASGGSWGPVSNLFLSDESGINGYLIASVGLSQSITLTSGQSINLRMGLSLTYCP